MYDAGPSEGSANLDVAQRIVSEFTIARTLLQRPRWLFLDEATSALDEASEDLVYHLLRERLPQAAVVSIAHHPRLAAHHERGVPPPPERDHRRPRGRSWANGPPRTVERP
ncbi:MAG: hypothetical protein EXR58_04245 [Chloroflexi bacterium]|nr:hypothetical protein [Chloroflexota bacterium]